MRKLYFVLALAVLCSAVAAPVFAATPAEDTPTAAEATAAPAETLAAPTPTPVANGPSSSAGSAQAQGIFCAFNCQDGTGIAYSCHAGSFAACCPIGQNGCDTYHGGTISGTCWQGNLGMPCTGI
ncbi:MAG: hypothetical protein KDD11_12325 [Acidobacteria bacterium]|nr:hypothetical protein [Acidobacteriota bacterium]